MAYKLKPEDLFLKKIHDKEYYPCKNCGGKHLLLVSGSDYYGNYNALVCEECGSRVQVYNSPDVKESWNRSNKPADTIDNFRNFSAI